MALPEPIGRQCDVAYMPASGHQVVLGTAGTGKTVMAIHRAAHLSDPEVRNSGSVLLVTYTRSLVTYLKHLTSRQNFPVTVETYGRFARGYLNSRGLMRSNAIANSTRRAALVRQAIGDVRSVYRPSNFFDRPIEFFLAELAWIDGVGLEEDLEAYLAIVRVGRIKPLQGGQRTAVWKIRDRYRTLLLQSGKDYDWHNIATSVRDELAKDEAPRKYRHIVIDEGQDLTPQEIRSLVDAITPDGSITFFADYAQQLYGNRISWKSIGLKILAEEVFTQNYRNTTEVAQLALAMAAMPHFRDVPDLVLPQTPTASGAKPTLQQFANEAEEIDLVRQYALDVGRYSRVGILARTWADVDRVIQGIPHAQRLHEDMTQWRDGPGIYAGAYHSGKGLEFEVVILPFCSTAKIPAPYVVEAFGEEDAASRESRLLYVGVTRAQTELLVTYTGDLTPLLPAATSDLWT